MENFSYQAFRYPSSDEDEGSVYLPSGEESSIPSDEYSGNTSFENSDTEVDDARPNILLGLENNKEPGPSSSRDQG